MPGPWEGLWTHLSAELSMHMCEPVHVYVQGDCGATHAYV